MSISGCRQDDIISNQSQPTVITADLAEGGSESRTAIDAATSDNGSFLGVLWTPGDSIGVFGATSTRNARFNNTRGYASKQTDFGGSMLGGEQPVSAYYPWSAANAGREPSELVGTLRSEQPFSLATGLLTDDWKWGRPTRYTGADATQGESARFTFTHLFALVKIEIDATGIDGLEGERLDYIDITTADGSAIAGDFTFSATDGSYTLAAGGEPKVRMRWTDSPELSAGASYAGFVTLFPDNLHADTQLNITVATATRRATFTVGLTTDFEAGKAYRFPLKLSSFADAAHGWATAARPAMKSFAFSVADNPGKLLDKRLTCKSAGNSTTYSFSSVATETAAIGTSDITLCVPYLYDFRLKPRFEVPEGVSVLVDGQMQTSGSSEHDFSRPVSYELRSADGDSRVYTVRVTNTGLPVVVINQSTSGDFSEVSAGNFINKKIRNRFVDFMIRGKDTEWVSDDRITVYNADGTLSMATATGGVRLRGNSTQKYPKKPLAIKLGSKASILGMPASKRWVLLANWIDRSMIRNAAGFAIAHTIEEAVRNEGLEPGLTWNPHGQNVELVIDGRHVGNYVLCEQIKIEKGRLNIKDSYEDVVGKNPSATLADCGFLIEFDQSYDEVSKFRTAKSNIPVQFKDELIAGNSALWSALRDKINAVEANLISGNYAAAYADYDVNAAIDQLLVYELVQNREYTEPRSVYYYINGGGRLTAGPVWDFDRGTFHNPDNARKMGNETNRIKPYDKWLFEFSDGNSGTTPGVWYRSLIKDPTFCAALKSRWAVLKPWLEAYVPAEIERLARENAVSWNYNIAMWPTTAAARKAGNDNNTFKDWSGDEEMATYDEVTDNMRECFLARLRGLDALINAL